MNYDGPCSAMDTQIFNLGLSIQATSAYILVTALMTDGVHATESALRDRWNAAPAALLAALEELRAFRVLEKHPGPGEAIYLASPASLWRLPGTAE